MTKKIKRNLILKIKGNLILEKDTKFEESIEVEGSITGYYNLTVIGDITAQNINAWDIKAWDIDARDIDARDIDAQNINAWNINAWNIDAWNIDARNINAWNQIFCEAIKAKKKIRTRSLIENRSQLEMKEW